MKITGNEPANPIINSDGYCAWIETLNTNKPEAIGLTIRQQFAMAAMQARRISDSILSARSESRIATPREIAEMSCMDADALINELNKSEL